MSNSNIFDFAVVGQGIAGTLLAYFLKKSGKRVIVIDDNFNGAASKVAAGIVNPITGKNYIQSWRIQEFMPVAIEVYEEISQFLGIQTYTSMNILRTLDSAEAENTWLGRTSDPAMSKYILNEVDFSAFEGKVNKSFSYGEMTGTFYVHLAEILDEFKNRWIEEKCYLTELFIYENLKSQNQIYTYKNLMFKEIIFCEGYKAINNPFFRDIHMAPAKGEVLLVKIPGADFNKMYKDKLFIVHQYDDVYWVGSGYEWNASDDHPTEASYKMLENGLKQILKVPYEVIAHKAAIRPTMHNRRPIFLQHNTNPGMFLFNGLGTKGSSIGPFAARQFSRFLVDRNPVDMYLI